MWLNVVSQDLSIPSEYIKSTNNPKRFFANVHRIWYRDFLNGINRPFLHHETFTNDDVHAKVQQVESLGSAWIYVLITVITKNGKQVIPLPKRSESIDFEKDLSYSQQLQYVTVTNRKNLWKEAYKKYDGFFYREKPSCPNICLSSHDTTIRDVLTRFYNCPIVSLRDRSLKISTESENESHSNILPANIVFETEKYFYLLQETNNTHFFQDCSNYSPALIKACHARPLFVVYQILNAMQNTHDRGLILGDITFSDIIVSPELWIRILPRIADNILDASEIDSNFDDTSYQKPAECLASMCEQWVRGKISNFDYLTFLNKLAGRKYGDPKCHHVFPWVTDFSSRAGLNYRDLTKSKYRLNKGDRQLDLTYDIGDEKSSVMTPHHVTDVLSEITYYVYRSRVTPRSVLCRYIRTKFVPEEYPSSIQRMQQWSPDECIPEFYTDPSVFKSIHKELPDLGVPTWAENVQDLVDTHRTILESNYISERLHHWIDLTFGYKLSGSAAVKSKNVCLQLCDNHTNLSSSGIVQLFTQPHPQRLLPSPYFSRIPPVMPKMKPPPFTETQQENSAVDNDDKSTHGFTKYLDFSKMPLCLPPDYNPAMPLIALDTLNSFLTGVCVKIFDSTSENDHSKHITPYKKIIANRRAQEIQVLGCLIVELFMGEQIIAQGSNLQTLSFSERLQSCRVLASSYQKDLPNCIRPIIKLLLQIDKISLNENLLPFDFNWYSVITDYGLPPPTAHQLLIPLLSSSIISFPKYFLNLYNVLKIYHDYKTVKSEMESVKNLLEEDQKYALDMFDALCKKFIVDIEHEMIELNEVGVFGTLADSTWVEFLVPMINDLMSDTNCNTLAALYLLEPSFKALGLKKSKQLLLDGVVKLYEECLRDLSEESVLVQHKWVKLYQKSFLMKLVSGFGTKEFLKNIVPILVETVGSGCNFNTAHPIPIQHLNDFCGSFPPNEDFNSNFENKKKIKVLESDTISLDDEALNNSIVSLQDVLLDDQVFIDYDRQSSDTNFSDDKSLHDVTVGSISDGEDTISCHTPDSERFNTEEPFKVAEVSAESLLWVANRIGPVHTSVYITKNLLKMLMLCYSNSMQYDDKAILVIDCLVNIAGVYGEQVVLVQYLPHITDVVGICKRSKMTTSLESGLIGCVTLLKYLMTYFTKSTLNEISQDILCKAIIHPMLRILSSPKVIFPLGAQSRSNFAIKLIDTVYFFGLKQGHLISKTIQRLFLIFDRLRQQVDPSNTTETSHKSQLVDSNNSDSGDSPSLVNTEKSHVKTKAMDELCKVLTPDLAYHSYNLFAKYYGESFMQRTLMNWDYVKELCATYKQERVYAGYANIDDCSMRFEEKLGHLTLKGNKILFQEEEIEVAEDAKILMDTSRHLKGNWVAYWEHEIGRSSRDTLFNFKQIKLQTFSGHQSTVKSLSVLDNENSFISSSRDKTVKLWSLRNQGDGDSVSQCQYTYNKHKKSVLSVTYMEKFHTVASCDSSIHIWDPWCGGRLVCSMNSIPVNILKCLPTPHPNLLAASTQPSLHSIDARTGKSVVELKISTNASGLIRSIAVADNGHWVTVGQSSGFLTVLDLRTGQALANWKGHEGEVLQLLAVDENTVVSSSLDQSLSVWNVSNGSLIYNMRGSPEPVHCLGLHGNELISGTTANRIGIHTGFTSEASFSSTKIRADTFKGVLTTMSVLSLNKLLMLGADNGNITLLC
ncbi:WD repeat-containing protein 81 [Adelges cooleyi]|uniref:WD repeat-containing protein 81 n=1 Tax=Adelges cooleyi TaxID=133065 RepID=UPI00217F4EBB|nr:WD repeat-containing protein 81 [Adelges cooleyi]